MSSKAFNIFAITCLLNLLCAVCEASAGDVRDTIQIYLPREVAVRDDCLKLGQVSIIRGEESLAAKASEISLGRISVPGQKIVIDRSTILSRLACNGIPTSKVKLTGAEKITVQQQRQIIKAGEFVELAHSFLTENPPADLSAMADSVSQYEPIRLPKDLVVPTAGEDIKLSTSLVRANTNNQANVRIAVLSNGKQIGEREVIFRLKYNSRRAITLVDIPAGETISHNNIKIEKVLSSYPEPAGWQPPYELVAKRRLSAKTVIRSDMVGLRKPAVIVNRNQTVVIRAESPGLLITAMGKTMQRGRTGDYIKVRNIDSQRIIVARVNEDGTVEPVF